MEIIFLKCDSFFEVRVLDRTQLNNPRQARLVNDITTNQKGLYFKRNYILAAISVISIGVFRNSRKTHERFQVKEAFKHMFKSTAMFQTKYMLGYFTESGCFP